MKSKRKLDKELFFVELYDSCKDAMYRRAYRVVRNDADAQDAVQNALTHLWEVLDKLPEESAKCCSYAVVAAYHAAIDLYKKNKRHLKLYSNITEDIVAMGQRCGVNPFHYIAAMENADEILRGLKRINGDYCEMIMLVYYHGFSIKETAAILDLSEKVAATKLFRARKALEKELVRLGYGAEEDGGQEECPEKNRRA